MIESRSRFDVKKDALKRYLIWHNRWLGSEQNIYVSEFPKSGGTWFCQLLSECIDMPFPRNQNLSQQPAVLHSHHFPIESNRCIHFMRDGRDVMVSAYHYFLLSPSCDQRLQKFWRGKMSRSNFEDVTAHLAEFIGHFNRDYRIGLGKVTWSDFILDFRKNKMALAIRYEQLHTEPLSTLEKVLGEIGYDSVPRTIIEKAIAKYDFKNVTAREKGTDKAESFMRKGIIGDWKNYFNKESGEVFNFYAGKALIDAGYETKTDWY